MQPEVVVKNDGNLKGVFYSKVLTLTLTPPILGAYYYRQREKKRFPCRKTITKPSYNIRTSNFKSHKLIVTTSVGHS